MERRGREIRLHGSEGGGAQQWAVENSRKSRDVAPLHFCCALENAQKMAAWRGATEVEGLKTGPTEALFNSPGPVGVRTHPSDTVNGVPPPLQPVTHSNASGAKVTVIVHA